MKIDWRALLNNQMGVLEAVRAMPAALHNLAGAVFPGGGGSAPAFITWALTTECQCNCRHCFMEPEPVASEATRLQIADRLAESGAWGVSLIGGEPLLVPGFLDYVQRLKDAGKRVSVGTNGQLLADFADDLVALGVDTIYVSVDSHRREVHDGLRHTPGLFDAVHAGLRAVAEAGRRAGVQPPRVVARCTLSRANVGELGACVDYWHEKVDGMIVQPIQDGTVHDVRDRSLLFTSEDETLVRSELDDLMKRHSFLRNQYMGSLASYIFDRDELFRRLGYQCLVQTALSLTILPDGRAMVCYGRQDSAVGQLPGTSVRAIWTDPATRAVQERTRTDCHDCFCWEAPKLFDLYLMKPYAFSKALFQGKNPRSQR
jgi:MoaA/NifB/PqqE/SkfB family radical SAM enzyme